MMSFRLATAIGITLCLLAGASCKQRRSSQLKALPSSEATKLAERAKLVLVTNCASCHGQNSSAEAGFDFVDNLNALVVRGYVIPQNSAASKLFKRIASKSMPPTGENPRLSDTDIDDVKKWIEIGAPSDAVESSTRKILPAEKAYELMLADLIKINAQNQPFVRYITFQNIQNAAALDGKPLFSDEEFKTYRKGFFKLINSLSRGRDIILPGEVQGSGEGIWRVNLKDYAISPAVWDRMMRTDPYQLEPAFEASKKVATLSQSLFPVTRGDWFVAVASIPPFYHDLLNIPSKLEELEIELKLNLNVNISKGSARRMGFGKSGVSNFNRLIERHELPSGDGALWTSYDFGAANGRKNLFSLPLGPAAVYGVQKSFDHDGGETIWSLPNGLQAYLLTKATGERIDVGPVNIVSDAKRPDRQVVNGLSCMHCHAEGIKRKDDEIRGVVLSSKELFSDTDQILALYQDKGVNDKLFDLDQKRFAQALSKLGISADESEPTLALQKHFEAEVSGNVAAAELGLSYDDFISRLNNLSVSEFGANRRDLAPLSAPGGTVKREVFAASFRRIAEGMGLSGPFKAATTTTAQPIDTSEQRRRSVEANCEFVFAYCMLDAVSGKTTETICKETRKRCYSINGFVAP